ncbi:hypothetical protein [Nocardia miyunensis]|uniref:hypothetical protein n=1 Tax=Nocardia miyunensis TaxID=282684 RepID=UPI0008326BB8|nr:hypothetical protein [Nocardia miyunensis]
MSDDQLGLDLGVEVKVDEGVEAWADWIAPERMESQIRELIIATLPDIDKDLPAEKWWQDPLLERIGKAVDEKFADKQDMIISDNADVIDQLARFVGEHFVRMAGAQWVNQAPLRPGRPIYDVIGPAIRFQHEEELEFSALALVDWIMTEGWVDVWLAARSYARDWVEWQQRNQ